MTVTKRRQRLSAAKSAKDIDVGDMVFNIVSRQKGAAMEVFPDGFITVDYIDGDRDCLPVTAFRRIRAGGHKFDGRRKK